MMAVAGERRMCDGVQSGIDFSPKLNSQFCQFPIDMNEAVMQPKNG